MNEYKEITESLKKAIAVARETNELLMEVVGRYIEEGDREEDGPSPREKMVYEMLLENPEGHGVWD